VVDDGIVSRLAHKAERTFAPNHQSLDDFNRVIHIVVYKGVDGVTSGALDGKLLLDERCELGVSLHAARQVLDAVDNLLVRLHERLTALLIGRIEHSTIDEDDAHILQRVIGVLLYAAAHTRGVVCNHATDHARVNG
jgi:hypothetical protein